jgi:hypothetical protein
MSLTFDSAPRGWTSYMGDHPGRGGCSSTWMIPEFRERATADYNHLEAVMVKLTKKQLRDFMAQGGREHFCGLNTKEALVTAARMDQYMAWYPYMEEVQ